MTKPPKTIASLMAVLALCLAGAAQAKSHLSRDELKIISGSSVQVIYADSGVPIAPYLDANHRAIAMGGLQGALANDVNQNRMDELSQRLVPYKATLDKLDLLTADYQLTQTTLASVAWLNKLPWIQVKHQSQQDFFIRDQLQKTKAQIVIFIEPQVEMAVNTQQLLMHWSIDIETVDGAGKMNHYEASEFTAETDVDPNALPPRASTPKEDEDDDDVHVEQMFINDAAGFKPLLARLTPQFQQQLYYFFTGQDMLPPAAATAAAAK